MTPEAADCLNNARDDLNDARKTVAIRLAKDCDVATPLRVLQMIAIDRNPPLGFTLTAATNGGIQTMRAIGLSVSLALTLMATCYADAREYLKDNFPQSRGFSTGVVTEGGKTVWLAGQNALMDEQGRSMAGNLEGQARVILRKIDAAVKRAGGSLKDVVTMTVYLTDPRQLDPLVPIFREFFPDGNFPAKTTITVPSLAVMGMMLEITAVAVIGDKSP